MPVCLNRNRSSHNPQTVGVGRRPAVDYQTAASSCIHIGLVNNMPDAALLATERQFITLLDAAADGILVHLTFYALPDVPRGNAGRHRVNRYYTSAENLWDTELDGLIVTGREPQAANLKDEPYWGSFTRVLEWAKDNTRSTVWSCLAAHAALLHMDGITRHRSKEKRCGVFDCVRLADHPLMAGVPWRLKMPHSRWNDIAEDELRARGYTVLTQAQDAGADTIVKDANSLFVFFQGHPEYESDSLLLEYRRDVKRYLTRETDTYPSMPRAYFDKDTEDALTVLREKAMCGRSEELIHDVAAVGNLKTITHTWHSTAALVYSNWLKYICAQKEDLLTQSKVVARDTERTGAA